MSAAACYRRGESIFLFTKPYVRDAIPIEKIKGTVSNLTMNSISKMSMHRIAKQQPVAMIKAVEV